MTPARLWTVALVGMVTIGLAGVLVGIGPAPATWDRSPLPATHGSAPTGVLPAVRYGEMDGKARGPNARYVTDVATVVDQTPARTAPVVQTAQDKAAALALRASRRAYAGAPPVIPHPVEANQPGTCIACHGQGLVIDGRIAPKMSHQRYTNCTQCHAQGMDAVGAPLPAVTGGIAEVANTFVGRPSPTAGSRAWPGAPPTMPHTTFMREDCTSCHGVNGRPGLRTTHPWRMNCLQCHATAAGLELRDRQSELPAGPATVGQ